jgi:hypothetical protein
MDYYVEAVIKVLEGQPLDAHDRFSFDLPPVGSQQDWDLLVHKTFAHADQFARLVEQFPENQLLENFPEEKYGNYLRNILGIIEHIHYHLGQIVLIRKIIMHQETA